MYIPLDRVLFARGLQDVVFVVSCVVLGMWVSGVLGWCGLMIKVRWAGLRGRETARSLDRSPLY